MAESREDIIKKRKGKFALLSHEGKVLGTHPTEAAAKAQESAINISKARAAGHRIPREDEEPEECDDDKGADENPQPNFDGLVGKGVFRRDAGPIGGLERPRINPGGFLEVDAFLSRTGVYEYANDDGSTRYELRTDEDVFADEALECFKGVPVTQEHPPMLLDMESARFYSRGAIAGPARRVEDKVAGTLVIHDAELADDILEGRRVEVSPGYMLDVDRAPKGLVVDGRKIDLIQRNIRINHVAVVKNARGGEEIRVRLDGLSNVGEDGSALSTAEEPKPMPDPKTKTITIHGISGEVPLHMAEAYETEQKTRLDSVASSQAKAEATHKQLAELTASRDALAAQVKEKDAQIARMDGELKAATAPESIAKAVKARVQLISAAKVLLGRNAERVNFDSMSNAEVRAKVLSMRGVRLDAVPEKQRDFYAEARFSEECRRVAKEIRRDARKDDDDDDDDDDDETPNEQHIHIHTHRDETQPQSGGLEGPGLSGKVTTEGSGAHPEWDDDDVHGDEEPGKESEEDDPVAFLGKAMKGRKDSREPRRYRFVEPAAEGSARNDAAGGEPRRQRADAKETYDTHLMDLGRQPLPSSRSAKK